MQGLINSYLGQYQILEVIGRGSMSTVYKAYQPSLNRYVGVKVLLRHLDPPFEARFRREAQAIAQLQHPNILTIYDYGEHEGMLYFVTQYIEDGVTLGDLMVQNPLEDVEALKLIELLLGALEYAHSRGIIHRDIKPSNVLMLQPTWPLLADFGIARLIDDSHGLTPPGQALGTAIYMAPERANAQEADQRSDLYSVGVMLYEMITGRVPFDGLTPVAILLKQVHEPPPPPRRIRPEIPESLEVFLLRALAKDPDMRYQTAAEMAQDLARIRVGIVRDRALQALIAPPQPALRAADPYQTDDLSTPAPPTTQASVVITPDTESATVPVGPALIDSEEPAGLHPERARQFDRFAFAFLAALLLVAAVLLSSALPTLRNLLPTSPGIAAGDLTAMPPPSSASADPAAPPTLQPTPETAPSSEALPTLDLPEPPTLQPVLPTEAPPALTVEPSPLPATDQPLAPTREPPSPTRPPTPPPAPVMTSEVVAPAGRSLIRLEDSAWLGGFRPALGRTYGGRSTTWIYGSGTEYSVMEATFSLPSQPQETARLTIEGMDSENAPRTLISIAVNGVEIFRDRNPLPDDDQPLESGTWASFTWSFSAALLQPGENTITIQNLDPGEFSLPPFFMLDYALLDVELS